MGYDVIVVGGGTAGCILAARLSEDSTRSVLMLEAGPDYPDLEQLPDNLKYGRNQSSSAIDGKHSWSVSATVTPARANPLLAVGGRVVGGTSAITPGQVFFRGIPEDFDHWASLGNNEWGFLKILPYFKKLETDADFRDDFHGSDGPIPVRRYNRQEWLRPQSAFYQACVDAGIPEVEDMNGPESSGVGPVPLNNSNGIRMSTALTHLNPARRRANLTIRPNAMVLRILFRGGRATGVELEDDGERSIAEGGEIVLSAGAIGSPKLLMLSGVGPADHLRGLGIPVVHDTPGVGQNLRDHPSVAVRLRVTPGFSLDPDAPRIQTVLRFTADGSNTRNDIFVLPSSFSLSWPPVGDPLQGEGIRLTCVLGLAVGAGEVTLTSSDPNMEPSLDYRYLVDSWDRQRLRETVRLCVRLLKHQAYNDIVAERLAPTDRHLTSDGALDAWLLANVSTAHHIAGTCKMGPASDPLAVVDQYCKVHGLEGLRVADASIMPDVVRANTNATAMMIGERAADLIG